MAITLFSLVLATYAFGYFAGVLPIMGGPDPTFLRVIADWN